MMLFMRLVSPRICQGSSCPLQPNLTTCLLHFRPCERMTNCGAVPRGRPSSTVIDEADRPNNVLRKLGTEMQYGTSALETNRAGRRSQPWKQRRCPGPARFRTRSSVSGRGGCSGHVRTYGRSCYRERERAPAPDRHGHYLATITGTIVNL